VGDKRDLPVADLLFEDTVGPSPVMVERQGGKELAHRALVLSVQRIALVAVDGQDTVVHPIVAVVCAVCSRVEVGDASVTFLVVGMERKTPGIVELIVDVQERIGSQPGKAGCWKGGPYERKMEGQIPFVQVPLVVRFEIQTRSVPDRIDIACYTGCILPGQVPFLAQESE